MDAANWIDRVKIAKGWESDYRAAKELRLSRTTISTYRGGPGKTMDEDTAVKVADALKIDPAVILADQAMERSKNETARGAWAALLERVGGVAAGVLVAVGVSGSPAPAQAHAASALSSSPTLYIM